MLKSIYIDNYKTLVDFKLDLKPINLLLGANGAGKTSVFSALEAVQQLVSSSNSIETIFRKMHLTRWEKVKEDHSFSLELQDNIGLYRYEVSLDPGDEDKYTGSIKYERIFLNGILYYSFENGIIEVYNDQHNRTNRYSFNISRSGLISIQNSLENRVIMHFLELINSILIFSLDPYSGEGIRKKETTNDNIRLNKRARNFEDWFYHFRSSINSDYDNYIRELQQVVPNLDAIVGNEVFGHRFLTIEFMNNITKDNKNNKEEYLFYELSEGQRILIILYSIIYYSKIRPTILVLDEPDNFVTLREIGPIINNLIERSEDKENPLQSIIISHHPEIIDALGFSNGILLRRKDGGATEAIKDLRKSLPVMDSGMLMSEIIARGWEND